MSLTATSTSPTETLRQGDLSTHASRTLMLAELGLLFEAVPASANEEGYLHAVLDDNVLLKRTIATRRKSLRHLRELYGLTPRFVLFGPLRERLARVPPSRQGSRLQLSSFPGRVGAWRTLKVCWTATADSSPTC